MTNEEIWKMQREAKAHREAVPAALGTARALLLDLNGDDIGDAEPPRDGLTAGVLRTLVKEVDRLQAALRQARQDMRDEQREAQYAASSAYSEGRHDGMQEGRGW